MAMGRGTELESGHNSCASCATARPRSSQLGRRSGVLRATKSSAGRHLLGRAASGAAGSCSRPLGQTGPGSTLVSLVWEVSNLRNVSPVGRRIGSRPSDEVEARPREMTSKFFASAPISVSISIAKAANGVVVAAAVATLAVASRNTGRRATSVPGPSRRRPRRPATCGIPSARKVITKDNWQTVHLITVSIWPADGSGGVQLTPAAAATDFSNLSKPINCSHHPKFVRTFRASSFEMAPSKRREESQRALGGASRGRKLPLTCHRSLPPPIT